MKGMPRKPGLGLLAVVALAATLGIAARVDGQAPRPELTRRGPPPGGARQGGPRPEPPLQPRDRTPGGPQFGLGQPLLWTPWPYPGAFPSGPAARPTPRPDDRWSGGHRDPLPRPGGPGFAPFPGDRPGPAPMPPGLPTPSPGLPDPAPAPRIFPDLVVAEIRATDRARVLDDGRVTLPISITVENRSPVSAGGFKISLHHSLEDPAARASAIGAGDFVVPGQRDRRFPWIEALGGHARLTLEGVLEFHLLRYGTTVEIFAVVDSVADEDFGGPRGRVLERDEGNNRSSILLVDVPPRMGRPVGLDIVTSTIESARERATTIPMAITLDQFVCLTETDDGLFSDSDEIYVLVWVADLGGFPPRAIGRRTRVYHNVDARDRETPALPIWDLDGTSPRPIGNPDNLIILVALVERDSSDADSILLAVQSALGLGLLSYQSAGLSRDDMVGRLRTDMAAVLETTALATGFGDPDERVGAIQELRITRDDLVNAVLADSIAVRSPEPKIWLSFYERGDGYYSVTFRVEARP